MAQSVRELGPDAGASQPRFIPLEDSQAAFSVPGKVMLSGEYAVLEGGPCLAITVTPRLKATVTVRAHGFTVISSHWPDAVTFTDRPRVADDRQVLCDTVWQCAQRWQVSGALVAVSSDLDPRHGVGTSSALRLSLTLAFGALAGKLSEQARLEEARFAWSLQQQDQSLASGYDILTQLLGGLVAYQPQPPWPGPLVRSTAAAGASSFHFFVGGRGSPTGPVARATHEWLGRKSLWPELLQLTNTFQGAMQRAFCEGDLAPELFAMMGEHRAIFRGSPADVPAWHEVLAKLPGCDRRWGYKTTGAGGEDALLVIAREEELVALRQGLARIGLRPYPGAFTSAGAQEISVEGDLS